MTSDTEAAKEYLENEYGDRAGTQLYYPDEMKEAFCDGIAHERAKAEKLVEALERLSMGNFVDACDAESIACMALAAYRGEE